MIFVLTIFEWSFYTGFTETYREAIVLLVDILMTIWSLFYHWMNSQGWPYREHSGSVVECLTQDRGAKGSNLTSVTVLCP